MRDYRGSLPCLDVRIFGWRDSGRPALRLAVALFALASILLFVMPRTASAESLCTDTWVGPAEGPWQTGSDWSTGKVPSSADVACIGEGATVKVTEGVQQAAVVQGAGSVVVTADSLEVANTLETSTIGSVSVAGGTRVRQRSTCRARFLGLAARCLVRVRRFWGLVGLGRSIRGRLVRCHWWNESL